MSPIAVMLVDDHVVVRKGLRTLLEVGGDFAVVAEAGTAHEAVARAGQSAPDIVIMDVRLPDGSGIEACRAIREARAQTRVIMLTSYPDEQAVVASILAGASGYLLKEANEDALLNALHIVARGGSLLEPDLIRRVLTQVRRRAESDGKDDLSALNSHERQILTLIAAGKTNREIGESLFLSENTVKNYVSRLLEKLGLSRRSEAAAYLARHQRPEEGSGT